MSPPPGVPCGPWLYVPWPWLFVLAVAICAWPWLFVPLCKTYKKIGPVVSFFLRGKQSPGRKQGYPPPGPLFPPPPPSKDLTHTLCCTLYAVQLLVTSKGYRIQYTFKHKNITFTNLLLQLGKDWKVGAQWKYIIKCIYLKLMLRHGTLKSWLKCPHFIFCSKWPWPTNLVFYIIPSFLSNCTKWPYLKQSIHQGRKKQGHCV